MFFLFQGLTQSWWGHSHTIIAHISQNQLTHKQISNINRILSSSGFETTDIEKISSWPDDLIEYNLKSMAEWHYADKPYVPYEDFNFIKPPPTYNVTTYINDAWETLHDPTTTDLWAWAFHIRNLIHYVGDIHTPHHNIARFTVYHQNGDMGGNLYRLNCTWGDACKNIHFLWDSCALAFPIADITNPIYASDLAKNSSLIEEEFPMSSFENMTSVDPRAWSLESYAIASTLGYALPSYSEPSQDYLYNARQAGKRRIAMAGYRLGYMLKELSESGLIPEPSRYKTGKREIAVWSCNGLLLIGIIVYVVAILTYTPKLDPTPLITIQDEAK
ncbi:hypothetical protein TVAG_158820 [Trichomonas vaginalis G3]|uniref:Uncharacterized protein n=1 Tax=Trichomonas vaginalis (strain ATCC PRA-98 / G3) TaxID=412133 RepID=A2E6R1_TRIV3|nr:S1-P1 nuclease family [Trichomonas vaginalis G3]EAY11655.1 hypothetical protein TVAG_158820 [Trichomonas vaginalis G3]KAI5494940.1 S1-P1 nuclease family [Trichomonas vaginalis G3]|eukprot:XP_001323878.1 hypothetical protein [Trichomonas vaginalis G3]